MKYFIVYSLAAIILWPAAAFAAPCTNPSGDAGDQIYNTTYNVMQYCNGNHWVAMGSVMEQGDNLGNRTSDGILNMSGFTIQNLSDPTNNSDAASKQYVDAAIGASSVLPSCNPGRMLISTGGGEWDCLYHDCKTPWNDDLEHGNTVTAYSAENASNCTTVRGTLECNDGTTVNGTVYTYPSCTECPWASSNCTGASIATAGYSCKAIKEQTGTATNGVYWIRPTSAPAFRVYCDMQNNGGGWTLVVTQGNDRNHINSAEVGSWSSISTMYTTAGKYSDEIINALLSGHGGHSVIRVTGQASPTTGANVNYAHSSIHYWKVSTWRADAASTISQYLCSSYDAATGALSSCTGSASGGNWTGVSSSYGGWPCYGAYGYTSGNMCGNLAGNGWNVGCGDCAPSAHSSGTFHVWVK